MTNPRPRAGLITHGTTVAMTPARTLTSHLRRRYRERYRGRYRRAPWVFALDVLLAGLAVGLVLADILLGVWPVATPPGIGLEVTAPPIVTAKPLAISARVISHGRTAHSGVRLTWDLPGGTEILSATPPLTQDHDAYLGDLAPGQELKAMLVVRLFVPPGSVRFGFRIQDSRGSLAGSEVRPVVGSALEFHPLVEADARTAQAQIPFLLKNDSNQPLETVELVPAGAASVEGKTRLALGTLAPFESRAVLVEPGSSDTVSVQAVSHAVPLVSYTQAWPIASAAHEPAITLSPSIPGRVTQISASSSAPFRLAVFHPALRGSQDGLRLFDLAAGATMLPLPLDPNYDQPIERWFAMPLFSEDGRSVLGSAVQSVVTTPFRFSATARYFAATGDQIGVGPLPPVVGQATKYWVSWQLQPTSADLSGLTARATLPPHVRWTGNSALPDGGTFAAEAGDLVWDVPFVPSGGDGTSASFELELIPSADERGKVAPLLGSSHAQAQENRSGTELQADAPALTTDLLSDARAKGLGRVQ